TTSSSGRLSRPGGAAVSAHGCDCGPASPTVVSPPGGSGTVSSTELRARWIRRSGSSRSAASVSGIDAHVPSGQRQAGQRLDVHVPAGDEVLDLRREEAAHVDALVAVRVCADGRQARGQEEVHDLGGIAGYEWPGAQRAPPRCAQPGLLLQFALRRLLRRLVAIAGARRYLPERAADRVAPLTHE